jgi:hypothetical protein
MKIVTEQNWFDIQYHWYCATFGIRRADIRRCFFLNRNFLT